MVNIYHIYIEHMGHVRAKNGVERGLYFLYTCGFGANVCYIHMDFFEFPIDWPFWMCLEVLEYDISHKVSIESMVLAG